MGKVTVTFKATNYDDLSNVARKRTKRKPRQIEAEALVDTGATRFYLQRRVIVALGLRPVSEITSRTMSDRAEKRTVFSPVKLEIQGRTGHFDVIQLPDTLPNIISQNTAGASRLGGGPAGTQAHPEPGAQARGNGRRILTLSVTA